MPKGLLKGVSKGLMEFLRVLGSTKDFKGVLKGPKESSRVLRSPKRFLRNPMESAKGTLGLLMSSRRY